MATIPNILRNVSLFVDGRGYAGEIDEVTPPKLTLKTEEFRAGGMDAPVELDMGMEKLECTLQTSGIDQTLLEQFGVALGSAVPLTLRGAVQGAGPVTAVAISLRGIVKEIDFDTWKPAEKVPMKAMLACTYYKLELGGQTVHEIDVLNMVRIVNGKDQLAEQREALGI